MGSISQVGVDGAEEVVAGAPEASVAQALDAARAARDAFPAWSRTTPEHRAELLQRTADLVRDRLDDLLPLVIAETGCTAVVGKQMQVPQAAVRFDAYARYALESPVIPLPPMEDRDSDESEHKEVPPHIADQIAIMAAQATQQLLQQDQAQAQQARV